MATCVGVRGIVFEVGVVIKEEYMDRRAGYLQDRLIYPSRPPFCESRCCDITATMIEISAALRATPTSQNEHDHEAVVA